MYTREDVLAFNRMSMIWIKWIQRTDARALYSAFMLRENLYYSNVTTPAQFYLCCGLLKQLILSCRRLDKLIKVGEYYRPLAEHIVGTGIATKQL